MMSEDQRSAFISREAQMPWHYGGGKVALLWMKCARIYVNVVGSFGLCRHRSISDGASVRVVARSGMAAAAQLNSDPPSPAWT